MSDQFAPESVIRFVRNTQARLGTAIDGRLANELPTLSLRTKIGAKGHSRKPPAIRAKNARLSDGTPVHLSIDRKAGMIVWSHMEKRILPPTEPKAGQVRFTASIDLELPIRFVAKTALAAGYYCYGETFRRHVKHKEPRWVMNNYGDPGCDDHLKAHETTGDHHLSGNDSKPIRFFRVVCKAVGDSSCVGLVPNRSSLTVFVGLFGRYLGMLDIPAETEYFPQEGDFLWGRFICPHGGVLKEVSWAKLVGYRKLA